MKVSPFTKGVIVTIVLFYAISTLILFTFIGPWEAVRNGLVNGLILLIWLVSADRILHDIPIPTSQSIRYPIPELIWSLFLLAVAIAMAAAKYAGQADLPSWILPLIMSGGVFVLFVSLGYSKETLGLTWPSKRAWMALLAIITINFLAAALFQILPPGEKESLPQADLANQLTGPWSVIILIASLLLSAALPEELLLRVTIQPRLAQFVSIGWAMLLQALLFSVAHLPQRLIGYQETWFVAIGYSLALNNGLIGGYFWWRTRSLPLLLLLHLFAFPRIGI